MNNGLRWALLVGLFGYEKMLIIGLAFLVTAHLQERKNLNHDMGFNRVWQNGTNGDPTREVYEWPQILQIGCQTGTQPFF